MSNVLGHTRETGSALEIREKRKHIKSKLTHSTSERDIEARLLSSY